jgi:hypothetical protein
MKNKGVVEVIVILYIVGAFLAGVLLWKPATTLLGISNTPRKIDKTVITKETKRPVLYYTDKDGNNYVAYATTKEQSNMNTSEEPKLTLWQKIKNLGLWGIVLVVLGCLFPPVGAVLLFIWNKVTGTLHTQINSITQKQEELSAESKKIVLSVDEGLAVFDVAIEAAKGNPEIYALMVNLKKDFLTALSKKQDATTKLLVAQLKND